MWLREEVSKDIVELCIGWRFDDGDIDTQGKRLSMAIEVSERSGCQINKPETRTLKTGITEVDVLAVCPIEVESIHHKFDSALNTSYPKGCGAAWVLRK